MKGERFSQVIGRNLRVLGVAQFIVKLSLLATVAVLARYLGRSDFGRYTVAVALVSLVAVTLDLGTGTYVAREGTRKPEEVAEIFPRVIVLRAIAGILGLAVATCAGIALNFDRSTLVTVILLTVGLGLRGVSAALLAVLQALEKMGDVAAVQIREAVAGAASMVIAAILGTGVVGVAFAYGAVSILSPVWAYRRLSRSVEGAVIRPKFAGLLKTVRLVAPFAASAIFTSGITYLDTVMVHAFKGNSETGLYGAAYRLMMAFEIFPTVYYAAVLRSATRSAKLDRDVLSTLYSSALLHLNILAAPLVVVGVLLSRPILGVVYGETYSQAHTTFAFLMAAIGFTFPAWVMVMIGYALGRERTWAVIVGAALVGNVAANLFAIPRWGIEGAAEVTLVTMALVAFLGTLALHVAEVRADISRVYGKPYLASIAMSCVVFPLRHLPLVVPLVIGVITYVVALAALRTFQSADRDLLRAVIGGKRVEHRTDPKG